MGEGPPLPLPQAGGETKLAGGRGSWRGFGVAHPYPVEPLGSVRGTDPSTRLREGNLRRRLTHNLRLRVAQSFTQCLQTALDAVGLKPHGGAG